MTQLLLLVNDLMFSLGSPHFQPGANKQSFLRLHSPVYCVPIDVEKNASMYFGRSAGL
jgi:hypothetical protein